MPIPERIPLWRRTPPAVFPPIMGLFGLGLAWRRAAGVFGIPTALSDLILGAVSLMFVFFALSYLAKFVRRPGVLVEDIRVLPGLAGLSAMTLSAMLMAAGLAPVAPGAATWILWAALAAHVAVALLALRRIVASPPEGRLATPAWHLTFVGFIIVPLAAAPLGLTGLATLCFYGSMPVALVIYGASLRQILRRDPPPPLRPLLAIHLAPLSVFGTAALLLNLPGVALGFAAAASAVAVLLLARARYVTVDGFSPLWGAFTFPMAAYASLMLLLAGQGAAFLSVGGAVLAAATVAIPVIAARVLKAWAGGTLSARTHAAVA